jgi:Lon protease-like protein
VGCAGRIIKFEETEDNRYIIILRGFKRFNLISEKINYDNFRIAEVDWNYFNEDLERAKIKESFSNLKLALKKYFQTKNISVNMNVINACSDYNLVDQITMLCPFASEEKQLLLETLSIAKRNTILLSIIESYIREVNISDVVKH